MSSSRSTKKIVIYARTATAEVGSLRSASDQVRHVREALDGRLGRGNYEVIAELADIGASGSDFNRDGFIRVKQLVASGAVDMVASYDLARTSRDLVEFARLRSEWKAVGVEFFFSASPAMNLIAAIQKAASTYRWSTTSRTEVQS